MTAKIGSLAILIVPCIFLVVGIVFVVLSAVLRRKHKRLLTSFSSSTPVTAMVLRSIEEWAQYGGDDMASRVYKSVYGYEYNGVSREYVSILRQYKPEAVGSTKTLYVAKDGSMVEMDYIKVIKTLKVVFIAAGWTATITGIIIGVLLFLF